MNQTIVRLIAILVFTLLLLGAWEILAPLIGIKTDVQVAVNPIEPQLVPPALEKLLAGVGGN